eukprot:g82182.t1
MNGTSTAGCTMAEDDDDGGKGSDNEREPNEELPEDNKDSPNTLKNKLDQLQNAAGLKAKTSKPKPFKKGDYSIRVHLIECRDLKGRDVSGLSDPVCRVTCMKQKQHSKIHKQTAAPQFDEVLVFDFKDKHPNEMEAASIIVQVLDSNTFRSDKLIGAFCFDVGDIYYKPDHEVFRQWVALTDPTVAKNVGVQGYLQISIAVLGPGDEQKVHSEKEIQHDSGTLMPPEVEISLARLELKVYDIVDMVKMDETVIGSTCNPYIKLSFAGAVIKSHSVSGRSTARLLQHLILPVYEPVMSSEVRIEVWDKDNAGLSSVFNDLLGVIVLDYTELKAASAAAMRDDPDACPPALWHSIYGAPELKQKSKTARHMNSGLLEGVFYRARLLASVFVTATEENVKASVSKLKDTVPPSLTPLAKWRVEMDLYQGSEIPSAGGHYHVELRVGTQSQCSARVKNEDGQCQWYTSLRSIEVELPNDPKQVPDVFVYLVVSTNVGNALGTATGKRICYYRVSMAELVKKGWEVAPSWQLLTEDPVLNKLDNGEFPGTLLFGLRAGLANTAPDPNKPDIKWRPLLYYDADEEDDEVSQFEEEEEDEEAEESSNMSRASPKNQAKAVSADKDKEKQEDNDKEKDEAKLETIRPTSGKLLVTIKQAEHIPAKDSTTSDPYVKFTVGRTVHKTKVLKKTLAPVWNESFTINNVSNSEEIQFAMYDKDTFIDDLIGKWNVDLLSLQREAKQGDSFKIEKIYLISDKYPAAKCFITFEYQALMDGPPTASVSRPFSPSLNKLLSGAAGGSPTKAAAHRPSSSRLFTRKKTSMLSKLMRRNKKKPLHPKKGTGELGMPSKKNYQLRVFIYHAQNLLALDEDGLADPYVVIRCCGKKVKTKVKKNTTNPLWYEKFDMNINAPEPIEFAPSLQAFVFDQDMVRDEVIGRLTTNKKGSHKRGGGGIPLDWVQKNTHLEHGPEPRWFPLCDNTGGLIGNARVLAAFQLLTTEGTMKVPPVVNIAPICKEFILEVTVLGLRDLQCLIGPYKPRVEFQVPTYTQPTGTKRFYTSQSRKPLPKSPNFCQCIQKEVLLPVSAIYSPAISVEVRDVLFGGLVNRLLGSSSIDIAKLFEVNADGTWRISDKSCKQLMMLERKGGPSSYHQLKEREKALFDNIRQARKLGLLKAKRRKEKARQEREEAKRRAEQAKNKRDKARGLLNYNTFTNGFHTVESQSLDEVATPPSQTKTVSHDADSKHSSPGACAATAVTASSEDNQPVVSVVTASSEDNHPIVSAADHLNHTAAPAAQSTQSPTAVPPIQDVHIVTIHPPPVADPAGPAPSPLVSGNSTISTSAGPTETGSPAAAEPKEHRGSPVSLVRELEEETQDAPPPLEDDDAEAAGLSPALPVLTKEKEEEDEGKEEEAKGKEEQAKAKEEEGKEQQPGNPSVSEQVLEKEKEREEGKQQQQQQPLPPPALEEGAKEQPKQVVTEEQPKLPPLQEQPKLPPLQVRQDVEVPVKYESDEAEDALLDQALREAKEKEKQEENQKEGDFTITGANTARQVEAEKKLIPGDDDEDEPDYLVGRYVLDDELEDHMEIGPFMTVPMRYGRYKENKPPREVGRLKGLVRLIDKENKKRNKSAELADMKSLLCPRDIWVRLYVLKGMQLAPKDKGNSNDPYLVVKLGKKKISTREQHRNDTL